MKKKITFKPKSDIQNKRDIQISPFVKSLSIRTKITTDFDYKKEYGAYLDKKYK